MERWREHFSVVLNSEAPDDPVDVPNNELFDINKVNQNDGQRLNTFHNRCLRRILRIFWLRTISNEKLYEEVEISRITDIIKARRWSFIGHMFIGHLWERHGSEDQKRRGGEW